MPKNRIESFEADINTRLLAQKLSKAVELDKSLDIDFEEHYAFQNYKSELMIRGLITEHDAQLIYAALGTNHAANTENGGWTKNTSTGLKCAITKMMQEYLEMKLKLARR